MSTERDDSDIEMKPELVIDETPHGASTANRNGDLGSSSTSSAHIVAPKDEPEPDVAMQVENDTPEVERRVRVHALTKRQERKLVEYLEEKFLNIMGNFKKRCVPFLYFPIIKFSYHIE